MAMMKTIEMILMENHPNGIYNEDDVWVSHCRSNWYGLFRNCRRRFSRVAMMSYLLTFGAGMLAGVITVGIVLNLTILNQDRWK